MLGQRRGSAKRSVLPRRRQDLLAPLLGATRKTRAQLSNYPATRLQSSAHFMESFTNCSASKRPARTVNNLPLSLSMLPWMAQGQQANERGWAGLLSNWVRSCSLRKWFLQPNPGPFVISINKDHAGVLQHSLKPLHC